MNLIISLQVLLISLNILFNTVVSLDSDSKYYYEPVVLTGNDLPELLGMISHKMSLRTIFRHKHFRQKFHQKVDIFHIKISTASDFGSYQISIFDANLLQK